MCSVVPSCPGALPLLQPQFSYFVTVSSPVTVLVAAERVWVGFLIPRGGLQIVLSIAGWSRVSSSGLEGGAGSVGLRHPCPLLTPPHAGSLSPVADGPLSCFGPAACERGFGQPVYFKKII